MGAFHSTKNSEISGSKLNGTVKIPGKVFENLGIYVLSAPYLLEFPELSRILCSIRKRGFSLPTERPRSYDTVRNSSICFSGKIAGCPDELPVRFRPVCFISCVNN